MTRHSLLWPLAIAVISFCVATPAAADPAKEEALLPIERKFSSFTIRVTKTGYAHFASAEKAPVGSVPAKIVAITGRNSKDIWMLTDTGVVLQDDGTDIKFRQAKPCKWGEFNREYNEVGVHLHNIVADENEVHVFGEYRDMNTRIGGERRATLARDGKWKCTERGLVPDITQSSGALTWRAAYNMDGDACRISSSAGHCMSGPRFSPTHQDPIRDSIDMGIHNIGMWMYGPDDGFVLTMDEYFEATLYRFNGVAWTKQATVDNDLSVHSMWADEQRHVWFAAGTGSRWDAPATQILRFDGKTISPIATPKSFTTKMVRGHSSKDIWFGGQGDVVYQWDGARLRQGKLPGGGEVSDMWVSSDDVAFFVMPDAVVFAAPSTESH